jgi:hypothetical protein
MLSGGGLSVAPNHRRNLGYRGLVLSNASSIDVPVSSVAVPWYPQDVRILLERDDSNQVTGLSLSCDMGRGVSFVRMTQK